MAKQIEYDHRKFRVPSVKIDAHEEANPSYLPQ
jgi:hypothetical protein